MSAGQWRWQAAYAGLGERFGTFQRPQLQGSGRLVAYNRRMAELLGLEDLAPAELLATCQGRTVPERSLAMVYAGHQFGVWAGRLGDGRGLLLGELEAVDGTLWDVHLKGAGLTPYSRMGDGRAVLRSSIREFLGGEALWGMGIPSTRALALCLSGESVWREEIEPGAMLLRTARTHVRFGHFEHFTHSGDDEGTRILYNFVRERLYPEAQDAQELYALVVERTAKLMADWMAEGFVHGVMNTDNMSMAGETLDFGPWAMMERFRSAYCPNHSDPRGRYSFAAQPQVGAWNLGRLALALHPVLTPEAAREVLGHSYQQALEARYLSRMASKLGLSTLADEPALGAHIDSLLGLMERLGTDYSLFFHRLPALERQSDDPAWADWRQEQLRLAASLPEEEQRTRTALMARSNPAYILRTWMLDEAIAAAAAGDDAPVQQLQELAQDPFILRPGLDRYQTPGPEDGACELSCSS